MLIPLSWNNYIYVTGQRCIATNSSVLQLKGRSVFRIHSLHNWFWSLQQYSTRVIESSSWALKVITNYESEVTASQPILWSLLLMCPLNFVVSENSCFCEVKQFTEITHYSSNKYELFKNCKVICYILQMQTKNFAFLFFD